jgi:DNA-binding GntR family transcriptional regulator
LENLAKNGRSSRADQGRNPVEAAEQSPARGTPRRRRPAVGRKRSRAAAVEEDIYRQIMRSVMENRLRPGSKLDEDRLAEIFHVSRTRLRKVITLLVNEHIVTHQLNYGAFISRPSIMEARHVFEARQGVEEHLVRLVCAKKPPLDLSRLDAFVEREKAAYGSGRSDTNRLSGDFHLVLAELTGNEVLVAFMKQLVTRTSLIQALYGPPRVCLVHEHRDIVAALKERQAARAVALMAQHLRSVEDSCDLTEQADDVVDLAAIFPLRPRGD